MRDKIAYLNESIEYFRPRESGTRSTLDGELQYLEQQLAESRSLSFKFINSLLFCGFKSTVVARGAQWLERMWCLLLRGCVVFAFCLSVVNLRACSQQC